VRAASLQIAEQTTSATPGIRPRARRPACRRPGSSSSVSVTPCRAYLSTCIHGCRINRSVRTMPGIFRDGGCRSRQHAPGLPHTTWTVWGQHDRQGGRAGGRTEKRGSTPLVHISMTEDGKTRTRPSCLLYDSASPSPSLPGTHSLCSPYSSPPSAGRPPCRTRHVPLVRPTVDDDYRQALPKCIDESASLDDCLL